MVGPGLSGARHEHEAGLAAFVVPERRARFRESLQSDRRRRKLLAEMYHFEDRLDPRFATLHASHTQHEGHVEAVLAHLLGAGAPPACFVLADLEHDGQEIALAEAVPALMWCGAGFLSCLPGRLGLYVGEDGSNVFVLQR